MKKIIKLTELDVVRIIKRVISEQYVELEDIFINKILQSLEKTDTKVFDELSVLLKKNTNETLTGAFNRVLNSAIRTNGREGGIEILKFCRKLSSINNQFAEEFYKSQIKVIDKIKEKYPEKWETLVKTNYGDNILEKYKKNNAGTVKPPKESPVVPKVSEKPASGISKGTFKTIPLERDRYGHAIGSKAAMFINELFKKVFYEGFDKRFDMWSMEIINKLTPETKSYLLQLKDIVKQKGLLRGPEMGFRDTYHRLPKTVDEEIQMLSTNFWGGYGRNGGVQTELDLIPIPTPSVIENLMNVTMTPAQKDQLMATYNRIYGK